MDYFFAGQLRAYRVQLVRVFSNFYVDFGPNPDGTPNLHRVPCRWGDTSRIAETIINNNSENRMPTAPFISLHIRDMSLAPERRAAPSLVSPVLVNERKYDSSTDQYLNTSGNRYTVKRYMPVPFNMTVNVDFWTTNMNQKEELFEQTQVLFNGMIDIQTSNNPLDWTLFTTMEPTNIIWSSRTIPVGTDNPIDVMTVEYKIPVWINPPAEVTFQKVIEEIITNINSGVYDPNAMEWTSENLLTRVVTTPDDAQITVTAVDDGVYELSLLSSNGSVRDPAQQPTQITGSTGITLIPGSVFSINGVNISVVTNSTSDLLTALKIDLSETNISVKLTIDNRLQIINLSGGDIILQDVSGSQVSALGFLPGVTYPGGNMAWWRLLEKYGALKNNYCADDRSVISLLTSGDVTVLTGAITGTIQFHPFDQNLLYWTVTPATWPTATQQPVNAIIDPHKTWPGNGLPAAQEGQRYMLTEDISWHSEAWGDLQTGLQTQSPVIEAINPVSSMPVSPTAGDRYILTENVPANGSWGNFVALQGDIIQYSGTGWLRVFIAQNAPVPQYVLATKGQDWLRLNGTVWVTDAIGPNDIIQYIDGQWQRVFDAQTATGVGYVKNNFTQKWYTFADGYWQIFPKKHWLPGEWRLTV
jgi:hypothetical protein